LENLQNDQVQGIFSFSLKILISCKKKREDGKFPYVEIDYQQAYKETTQEHDQAASKYLIWLLIPLFIGYAVKI